MSFDFNDAAPQRGPMGELIPDGTFAKIRMTFRPGGVNGASMKDTGLLKASNSSDAKMLDAEMTVVEGPHAKRKFWQFFTVAGGKLDDKGQSTGWGITKSTFRAMIDSALGLDPKDTSDAAAAKRRIEALKDLDGISFVARIMVEPSANPNYADKNVIANVVCKGEAQYDAVMRGEQVAPEPVKARARGGAQQSGAQFAQGGQAQGGMPWQQTGAAAQPQQQSGGAPGPAWLNS